jgi:hypothetical protein
MEITQGDHSNQLLPAGHTLTVVAPAGATGSVVRLGDQAGQQAQSVTAISQSTTTVFGPYPSPARFDLVCRTGVLTATLAPADTAGLIDDAIEDTLAGTSIVLSNLPTSDPAVAGALYNDSGTVKISAGA